MPTENESGQRAAIICDSVWKIFRSKSSIVKALQNVSFQISENEVVCVRGSSGSGKSTLLSIVGGLEQPTKGEVTTLGRRHSDLNEIELSEVRRTQFGFVFQELALIPHLTVAENVVAPLLLAGAPRKAFWDAARDLLWRVGLTDRERHLPRELSAGERQRVSIARSLINRPRILVADEPTANLDEKNIDTIIELFRELGSDGTTVVVATHENRFETVAHRVLWLDAGFLVQMSVK